MVFNFALLQEQPKDSLPASTKSVSTLTVSKVQANTQMLNIPKRKDPKKAGTMGRPIQVYANMMQIKFGRQFKSIVIHYDVDIVPNTPKYLMRAIFNAAKQKLFPDRNPAFDGRKNAFSAGRLPIKNPVNIFSINDYNI